MTFNFQQNYVVEAHQDASEDWTVCILGADGVLLVASWSEAHGLYDYDVLAPCDHQMHEMYN